MVLRKHNCFRHSMSAQFCHVTYARASVFTLFIPDLKLFLFGADFLAIFFKLLQQVLTLDIMFLFQ